MRNSAVRKDPSRKEKAACKRKPYEVAAFSVASVDAAPRTTLTSLKRGRKRILVEEPERGEKELLV